MSIEMKVEELRGLLAAIANIDYEANGDEHFHDNEPSDLFMCIDCARKGLDLVDEIESTLTSMGVFRNHAERYSPKHTPQETEDDDYESVNVYNLAGSWLDWAVSLITNPEWSQEDRAFNTINYVDSGDPHDEPYSPTIDWSQAGPLITEHRISIVPMAQEPYTWKASIQAPNQVEVSGSDPLYAAMMCLIVSHLGEEVNIPKKYID